MKRYRSQWRRELILAYGLFCLGLLCIVPALAQPPVMRALPFQTIQYSYRGDIETNLTLAAATFSQPLGICNRIHASLYRSSVQSALISLSILAASSGATWATFPNRTAGEEASVVLELPLANYTLELMRETTNTTISCSVVAYIYQMPPPGNYIIDYSSNFLWLCTGLLVMFNGLWTINRVNHLYGALFASREPVFPARDRYLLGEAILLGATALVLLTALVLILL